MKPRYICIPQYIDADGHAHVALSQPHANGYGAGKIVITSKVLRVDFMWREIETKNSIYHWE